MGGGEIACIYANELATLWLDSFLLIRCGKELYIVQCNATYRERVGFIN